MRINFSFQDVGWLTVKFVLPLSRQEFRCTVSYTTDAIGDFVRAIGELSRVEYGTATFLWDQEPSVVEVICEKLANDRMSLRFIVRVEFDGPVLSEIRFYDFFSSVVSALSSGLNEIPLKEYYDYWPEHPFPSNVFDTNITTSSPEID